MVSARSCLSQSKHITMYKRKHKIRTLRELEALHSNSQGILQLDFNRCSSYALTEFRKKVISDNSLLLKVKVVKHTLLLRIINTVNKALCTNITNLIVFIPKDVCVIDACKYMYRLLQEYENSNISLHSMILGSAIYDAVGFARVSSYPTRAQAISNIHMGLVYPMMIMDSMIKGPLQSVKSYLDAIVSTSDQDTCS